MKKLLLAFVLLASGFGFGQGQNFPGGGGGTTTTSFPPSIVTSGLIGQFPFTNGSGTVLSDISGSGNNGTLCAAGAAPSWATNPGGLTFVQASSQCVTLPSALNAAVTIELFLGYQISNYSGSNVYTSPIAGNGTAANTAALLIAENGNGFIGFSNAGGAAVAQFETSNAVNVWRSAAQGNFLVTWAMDAAHDLLYVNNVVFPQGGNSAGNLARQTAGVYQLGGRAAGYVNGNTSFYNGAIYYALFYNRKLTAAEVSQNSSAVNQIMTNRGVVPYIGSTLAGQNLFAIDGDSLPGAAGSWIQYAYPIQTFGPWQGMYVGTAAFGVADIYGKVPQFAVDAFLTSNAANIQNITPAQGGMSILDVQIGTNNLGAGQASFMQQLAAYCRARRAAGWNKIVVNSIIDRGGVSASKNLYNALIRASWRQFADALLDVAADPNLGCDGCSANTTYFNADTIHPSQYGQERIAMMMDKLINGFIGNNDFSSAATYTTAAPAATTITAATEATNTVTITMASQPFINGQQVTIAGVTPAGYNGVFQLQGISGNTFTYYNPTAGLGAGTVFGTASVPQQQDVDVYTILGGSAVSPAFGLQSCQGSTGQNRYFKQTNTTSNWVLTPYVGAETIDGAATLTMPTSTSGNNSVVILQSQLISGSAGGCTWQRVQ